MRTKTLGRTGLNVTIVGLGTAFTGIPALNPHARGYEELANDMDLELGEQTVIAAMEAGCTLIDTAALYGATRSERMIGRALAARPDLAARCIVTTKAGRTIEGQDYSYDAVMRSVAASLERLGLERFEVVYIHDAMGVPMDAVLGKWGALGALRHLQEQGIVRFVGTAADDPVTNTLYMETGEFDAAVVPRAWSLLNQLATQRILPAAEKHNIGLVIANPIERGLLATGPVPGTYYFDRTYRPEVQAHVGQIQALCDGYGVPMLAVALQWIVRHPQVTTSVPGARTPQEAIQNAQAAAVAIPDALWEKLQPLVRDWGVGGKG